MSEARDYDVVIVGGRVAGASLALLLARQGRKVVVVDRDRFPSDTLSTHFMPAYTIPYLGRLGVLDDLVAAGFRRILRQRCWAGDCFVEAPAAPADGFSLAPRRDVLDALLQEHAREAGADVLARTRAERLLEQDGVVAGVEAMTAEGELLELRARVVVGADGKSSKVAEWVGAAKYDEVPALRPGYYGYFSGVAPLPEPACELFFGDDTLGFLFPMRPDEDCLVLETQPEDWDAFRADPEGELLRRFRELPGMAPRLANARLEGKVKGSRGVDNFFRVPYGPGWALTGDAAYLKDPSTGLGMGDALAQSILLARFLGRCLDGADWDETMADYHRLRDEQLRPLYDLTLEFTRLEDPPREQLALLAGALSLPSVARSLLYALPEHLDELLAPPAAARARGLAAAFAAR
jgi:flavin-dependent dehydrogenase